ncbi:putative short-subunit dehydrogenase-like oxidoreductase (DUF2520 family) [Pedobacter sp. UYP30]|uniref:Rossmann-like and DUF2520 domain-containing protein n=1 Tax=Pedobacter sp. UYP30 TaxID=1756400 RepID=UPI003394EE55
MKIVILGSGNVATQLALSLNGAGENIIQIYSRQLDRAEKLASKINAQAVARLDQVSAFADVYLVAVKDDAILGVLNSLKGIEGVVAHTSGATAIDIFPIEIENSGVFYPLQTFSKDRNIDFAEIPICIEANNKFSLQLLESLASKISGKVRQSNSKERKALHIAAVFACNFSNHLYALAADILEEKGLAFDLIKPLIAETAAKVMENTPFAVQTGPAVRHDEATLASHLAWLADSPNLRKVYESMSDSIKVKYK